MELRVGRGEHLQIRGCEEARAWVYVPTFGGLSARPGYGYGTLGASCRMFPLLFVCVLCIAISLLIPFYCFLFGSCLPRGSPGFSVSAGLVPASDPLHH